MSVKKKVRAPNDENRLDALIQRLVSMWLSQQTEPSALSANQRSQFVAWVGADAERWLSNNWRSWPGRPANSTRPIHGRE